MNFRTIPDDGQPLKVVLVGVGGMGQAWLRAIEGCPEVELVGLVDLNVAAAQAIADGLDRRVTVGADAVAVAAISGGQAVIDVTVPVAHHPVTTASLFAGLPVLGEKPVASTVAQGLSLAAASEITGELFMVSQSRRYNDQLWEFKEQIAAIGPAGVLTTEFFKAPHFGGFRDEMDHPLLLDMAVHQLDSARYLLGGDPISVYCEEYNPSWSWYRGDAGCTAIFEMAGGARYVFTGSWCSPGLETSWNGSWRASGEHGSALWNGDQAPEVEALGSTQPIAGARPLGDGIDGSLREFVHALRTGETPMGEVHENVYSLAMVEAAIESGRRRARVVLADVMTAALDTALETEAREDVSVVLKSWQASGGYRG
ncbi:Predicted dehydrogenase [Nakamurella panacisegetis]|uniref:Predicted dehydrogenase n=1 Tax=Nakamurella panacisegetis TaxID=1090615 RepID=A0A1H0KCH8_9ACTN|nr:Gfo/Idh/MocA family oxidoreductase [Nakamurella panacisegetis]SDO53634.1 Predicted dehydrogenase [Nakamurella panacisegetis]